MAHSKPSRFIPILGTVFVTLGLVACGGGADDISSSNSSALTPDMNSGLSGSGNSSQSQRPNPNGNQKTVEFRSSTKDFPNPERGFLEAALGPSGFQTGSWPNKVKDGLRLVHMRGYLDQYRTSSLTPLELNEMTRGFEKLRETGMKAILRFSYYDQDRGGTEPSQAIIRNHIDQLKPILKKNADVIAVLEAGFLGPWGEWWERVDTNESNAKRIMVRDALLDALPSSRQIAIRYPYIIMQWYPPNQNSGDIGININNLLAPDPLPAARIGFHNDCFLADSDDLTYRDDYQGQTKERAFMKKNTAMTVSGGETCVPKSGARKSCPDILREGAEYHLTYLSQTYHQDFINKWKADGCFTEVSKKLGYRLRLEQARFDTTAVRGLGISWSVQLSNEGWARPINPRLLVLRLTGAGGRYDIPLSGSDLRRASPGERITLSGTVDLPAGIPAGQYSMSLGAPDTSESLASNPIYSIRFANDDSGSVSWDDTQGFMKLGITLNMS